MDLGFAGLRRTRFVLALLASFLTAISLSSAALAATDTDSDGLPDVWEVANGFNAYDPTDAASDLDGDGFSNLEEYRTGTDPQDAASYPAETTDWFESFENGVPADWDTSSDSTSDAWIQSPDHATDGSFSLRSPDFRYDTRGGISGMGFPENQISFTRNFAAGVLSADYYVSNSSFGWTRVYVDGIEQYSIPPYNSAESGRFSVPVGTGIHTITISFVRPFSSSQLYLDKAVFVADGPIDADGDGLPRDWELANGLDPNDATDALLDGDSDGLNNLEEYTAGTSINNADTDGDGLSDGEEVVLNSNPLNTDSDFDGLPDGWEVANGLNPLDSTDALLDSDGDGVSNLDEYRLKTNPQDASSAPQKVRRWFESFENGVPADASTDSTSDASSDAWSVINVFPTDGSLSLTSPAFDQNGGWQSHTISFTKYFEAGALNADVELASLYYGSATGEVLLDGYTVAWVQPGLPPVWSTVNVAISEGVHTLAFRVSGYPQPALGAVLPRLLVDNIRFIWDGDSDGDGLSDRVEIGHGLNPDDASDASADFDGDGLVNADEIAAGSDLRNADSDADGLGDADEVARGTSPTNADTDGDGLPDAYEVNAGLDPRNAADASQDSDGDGVSNYDEFRFGTDPNDPASVPQVTTRWFESFEAGVPADWDASSDTSSDASSDSWTVSNEFATDGAQSLVSLLPTTSYYGQYNANQISFTKLFVDGRLSLDTQLVDAGWNSWLTITVDGYERAYAYQPGQNHFDLDLSAGVHTVTIAHNSYSYSYYGPQRLFVDNVRFLSSGDTDGLPDIWEFDNGLNPDVADAELDSDNDGLSNAQEFAAGTNPTNADSDADGIKDGAEVTAGTNPLSGDSDNDGLPDAYELANGLNPLNASDAAADSDGDGFTNAEEFRLGTNPRDAHSKPTLVTSWFESFEKSVPSDWDSSTDASSDTANWPWLQSQDFATDGSHSLQSAPVPAGKRTEVYFSRYFAQGTLSFDFHVDTSPYYYCCDNFTVSVDGVPRAYASNSNSGRRFLQLTQGVHEIRFSFTRDYYDYYPTNTHRALIDNLRFEQGPIQQDSDSDGLPDAWEIAHGTNPYYAFDADSDYDGDGLSNLQEYFAGTNINSADSDGDGLSDSEEIDVIGSNPLSADSDGDGLPDAWEVANGTNAVVADADADSDGDGFSNRQEYLWGTAANDPGEPALQQNWFESFEAGFPADWDASGDASTDTASDASSDAPWQLSTIKRVPDGIYRLRSGAVKNGKNSAVSVSKFLQPGVLFFDYQVSSNPKDTLSVYVNGKLKLKDKFSLLNKRGEIALEGGYEQLKFVFKKNTKLSFASNAAFIDNLRFYAYGSDGDLDGMDDIWEIRHGLNPKDPTDALKDPDFDRVNNLQEFRNGTDPHHYDRAPRVPPVKTPPRR